MRLVGLTGGIGSGKSSLSERLAKMGAEIIDADAIVRELQDPGMPVFLAMVERWGAGIVHDSETAAAVGAEAGTLNRAEVAKIVFGDKAELAALEAMVHPATKAEIARRIDDARETDRTLILDNPLLIEKTRPAGEEADGENGSADSGSKWSEVSSIIVVDCPIDTAINRLIEHRGFDRSDAEGRVAAQATRQERLDRADFVIDNGGGLVELDEQAIKCWDWIQTLDLS